MAKLTVKDVIAARINAGMSQKELGRRAQVDPSLISMLESGKRTFTQSIGNLLMRAIHEENFEPVSIPVTKLAGALKAVLPIESRRILAEALINDQGPHGPLSNSPLLQGFCRGDEGIHEGLLEFAVGMLPPRRKPRNDELLDLVAS